MPDSTKKSLRRCLGLFLCASRQFFLPGRFQANVQHCTWLGSTMCAACGGFSTWGNTWESRTLPDSMKKGLTPYRVGSFFIPSATFLFSGRLQSMCDIVLGAEIERALRAVQRDEGWNCKGAPRRRSKRKPLTLPHNTTSRASTKRRRLSCQPLHLYFITIQPAQQGRSGKEKSNPAQKGLFRRYAEAFSEDFFQ